MLCPLVESQNVERGRCQLDVLVKNSNGQAAQASLQLLGAYAFYRTTETNSSGYAIFLNLPEDDYTLVVRHQNGKEVEDRFSLGNADCIHSETVRFDNSDQVPSSPEVFVADLRAPTEATELYQKGVSELHRQRWQSAERLLTASVNIYPQFSAAYNALGIAASENGNFQEGNAAFLQAIRLRKNYSEAYLNFAKSLFRQKKFTEAEALLNDFLSFDSPDRTAFTLLAECLFQQQRFDDVIGVVRQVHSRHYAHDLVLHRLASEIYKRRGMIEEFQRENATIRAESGTVR
jgi:tetratricopeptide (TPR) repeat protein